jgi:ribosomal protein S18 acetylase RimI-like enzyme
VRIEKVTEKYLLHACRKYLSTDPLSNVLPLGDLYAPLFDVSEVYAAVENGRIAGVSSVFHAFSLPTISIGVAPEQVRKALLEKALGTISRDFVTLISLDETSLYKERAKVLQSFTEHQMVLTKPQSLEASDSPAHKATKKDLEALNGFYVEHESEAWNPIQFRVGPYYIVKEGDEIVSAAGVHILTPQIAQLGNVMTDQAHRRKGYSKACTTALVRDVSSKNRIVSLFVRTDNAPAIRMYEQIGFEKHKIIEFLIMRKKSKPI